MTAFSEAIWDEAALRHEVMASLGWHIDRCKDHPIEECPEIRAYLHALMMQCYSLGMRGTLDNLLPERV